MEVSMDNIICCNYKNVFEIVVILLLSSKVTHEFEHEPYDLPDEKWPIKLIQNHIVNMTAEFIADTTYKLKYAEKIKNEHSHSITYELGFIAAGIQERFQRMLKTYRKYADIRDFDNQKYTPTELLNAYHVMQGDYNEIRLEKSLFYNIVWKHENNPTTKKDLFAELFTRNPKWKSNL